MLMEGAVWVGHGRWPALVLLLALLCPTAALAQFDDAEDDDEDARAEAAQQLVLTARTMMRAKKYQQGIVALETAYQLFPQVEYLFSIARATERLPERCPKAVVAWDRFLEACTDCPQRGEAKRRRFDLEETCAREAPAVAAAAPPPAPMVQATPSTEERTAAPAVGARPSRETWWLHTNLVGELFYVNVPASGDTPAQSDSTYIFISELGLVAPMGLNLGAMPSVWREAWASSCPMPALGGATWGWSSNLFCDRAVGWTWSSALGRQGSTEVWPHALPWATALLSTSGRRSPSITPRRGS